MLSIWAVLERPAFRHSGANGLECRDPTLSSFVPSNVWKQVATKANCNDVQKKAAMMREPLQRMRGMESEDNTKADSN